MAVATCVAIVIPAQADTADPQKELWLLLFDIFNSVMTDDDFVNDGVMGG
jgi:hypothetical protein